MPGTNRPAGFLSPQRESKTLVKTKPFQPLYLHTPTPPTFFNLEVGAAEQNSPAALGVTGFQITALRGQGMHRTYSQHADGIDDRKQRHVHVYDGDVP